MPDPLLPEEKSVVFAFGSSGLVFYLAFLSAFVPISTGLYLPSLPGMALYFDASPEITSLSLSLFTLSYGISMLMWGPISDKYGRKSVLLAGLLIYILASIGLALCLSVYQLIGGRCIQALASGAVSAVAMAIVKDSFRGRRMESILTAIQTMTLIAPLIAPVLGGVLLSLTSWRGLFWVLTGCGLVAFMGWFALRESLAEPTRGSAFATLGRIAYVLGHRNFRSLLLVLSASNMPFLAYIAISSYVYESGFHTTPQQYSYFFAANAFIAILGPILYGRWLRNVPRKGFIAACYAFTALFGLLLALYGQRSAFIFMLLYMPLTFCGTALRPAATVMLMNQLDTDNGTVASIIGSTGLFFGSAGMLFCSLPWNSFILAAGILAMLVGVLCTLAWLWLDKDGRFTRHNHI